MVSISKGSFTTNLRERFYLLGQSFPGFDQVLTQALFALLTREHILWYSKPGRAKSMVARAIFDIFDNASVFTKQLTKDTLPDAIFGNIVADRLMSEGVEVYNLKGGLADVTFAYLDEFFDASDFVLRAMLNVLNEREFHGKDQGTIQAPLHSVIATTNYLRKREATEAVLDRLLCKAVLSGVQDLTDVMRAGQTYLGFPRKAASLPLLPYEDLLALAEHVERPEADGGIIINSGMRMLHVILVQEFQRRRTKAVLEAWQSDPANENVVDPPSAEELGIPEVTPRTVVKLHDFSRAAAVLNDRTKVTKGDQRALGYGLVVIGDGSGQEILWHTLCDEFLRFNARQLEALESLAEIADQVGRIKAERSQTTQSQLILGGQAYVATEAATRTVIDNLTGSANHPVLQIARRQLHDEIRTLDDPRPDGFDLMRGWQ